ncbi:triacylglycerol lipase [Streptomyces sp. ISL-100]|uniref:esterase/lipase family protein n=1 Tax=Streptomyces sp. ISL-100 TaxID=2819173 RepID=UPI001BE7E673|nr:triacylglycerol lipase [Streptomyces sp. ISL-100]MBT2400823.1 triacylglycerol lipase [Streptomyces sp. ISL-100]
MRISFRAALSGVLAAGLLAALSLQTPAGAQPAAAAPDPIVFVHGWNSSGSTWDTMAGRFATDGWPASHLDKWTYSTSQSNATTASQLSAEIDRVLAATGATKVDVVTHSMGGLSSRYFLKNLGGDTKVDAWISLGGPNHGTDTAYFCGGASCTEMRPGSSFLNALNSGDETPGASRYATWWSACDSTINPDNSVALTGATNAQTACLSHGALRTDITVYNQVKSFVG